MNVFIWNRRFSKVQKKKTQKVLFCCSIYHSSFSIVYQICEAAIWMRWRSVMMRSKGLASSMFASRTILSSPHLQVSLLLLFLFLFSVRINRFLFYMSSFIIILILIFVLYFGRMLRDLSACFVILSWLVICFFWVKFRDFNFIDCMKGHRKGNVKWDWLSDWKRYCGLAIHLDGVWILKTEEIKRLKWIHFFFLFGKKQWLEINRNLYVLNLLIFRKVEGKNWMRIYYSQLISVLFSPSLFVSFFLFPYIIPFTFSEDLNRDLILFCLASHSFEVETEVKILIEVASTIGNERVLISRNVLWLIWRITIFQNW